MSAEEIDVERVLASIRYLTERTSDVYETIVFNTDDFYNQPAVSFELAGARDHHDAASD